jgi:protein-tyrosine-phosphatase
VCEHGAAKSVVAAAYFNHFAQKRGLRTYAVARGTHPDEALSPQAVQGLGEDGLQVSDSVPQKLTQADLQCVKRVVTFCQLPEEYQPPKLLERWDDIPAMSQDYEQARDAIVERILRILNE